MKKLRKICISFLSFIIGTLSKMSKVFAIQALYAVKEPIEPTMGEKVLKVGKFVFPIVLFIIGLFVVLSKKIKRKTKIIVIFILIILAIIGYQLMNYIAMNF